MLTAIGRACPLMDSYIGARDLFLASLERCLDSEDFVPAFYHRFLASSEEVAWKFRKTDFDEQNSLIVRSLRLIAAATKGEREGLVELRERAQTHDRYHLGIKPKLYDLWRTSVIETAREFDGQWREDIEAAWVAILNYAIDYMVRRY